MISEAQYTIDDEALPDGIAHSLNALVPARTRPIVRHRLVLLDTFNGRIAAAGGRFTACKTNGSARLEWLSPDHELRLELPVKKSVDFAWDLPSGPLRDSLEPIIAVRRLLPQVEVEIQGSMLDVLNDDRKTVARIRIEVGRARPPQRVGAWRRIPMLVTVTALRGYGTAYERLLRIVESRPGLKPSHAGLQGIAFQAVGAVPPRDVSRFDVSLVPSVHADAGARQIHMALLEIMVANEAGVRADLDTEFLHDYRVSLRRTRSLLGQIKDVFPAEAVAHFRAEFQWLAQSTGPKRDLDVLLLSLRRISESLPADDLSALLDFLSQQQLLEQRLLEQVLDSDRYQSLLARWRNFLQDPPPEIPKPKNAARPLVEVASRRILRLYRRLVDEAAALDAESPPDAIHQVRIQGKKLRYMIDALRSLRDRSELDRIISSLKKVQSVLGDFNDAQTQERSLLNFGRAFVEAGGENPGALLTLGRLAEKARNRALSLRAEVDHELSRFCKDRSIRSDFCRLFKRTTS